MNIALYQFKCCFGPYGCSCLCISPVRQSITTRVMYSLTLIIISILCIFLHESKFLPVSVNKLNPKINITCIYLPTNGSCISIVGYKAIYRIAYSFSAFHLLMALFCINVSSSQEWRAKFHNGFWFFKFIIKFIFLGILFYIPNIDRYITVATIIGVIAAIIFIIIQDVSLIDCAYEFNEYLRAKGVKNCCYDKLLYLAAFFLYVLTITGYVFIYFHFALPKLCQRNRIIIIINASATFVIVLFSFFVEKYRKNKLYIPAGVTSLFVAFLTWTALNSAPYEMLPLTYKSTNLADSRNMIPYNNKNKIYNCKVNSKIYKSEFGRELDNFVGILIMLAAAVYCCIKSTAEYKRYGIKPARSKNFSSSHVQICSNDIELQELKIKSKNRISGSHLTQGSGDKENILYKSVSMPAVNFVSNKNKKKNLGKTISKTKVTKQGNKRAKKMNNLEEESTNNDLFLEDLKKCPIDSFLIHDDHYFVQYSYSWFHFIFSLAYLFVMVQLTNWYSPQTSHILDFVKSWPSFMMKIATSWIALGLFSWTLLCPAFCIGRRLYEYPFDSVNRYRNQLKSKRKKTDAYV